jgi:hypothetical protein
MFVPGGYLNLQTTDMQYFDFTDTSHLTSSQAHEHDESDRNRDCDPTQDDNFPFTSEHTDSKSQHIALTPPITHISDIHGAPTALGAQIVYNDRHPQSGDNATKLCLWALLDASINGPHYGDGRTAPWYKFPTVTQQRPEVNYTHSMREIWRGCSSNKSDLMDIHISTVHCLAGASPYPPSILQGEFIFLADFLSHLYPMMVRAATDSDLVRMQAMINVANDLLQSMQVLVDVEVDARQEINRREL